MKDEERKTQEELGPVIDRAIVLAAKSYSTSIGVLVAVRAIVAAMLEVQTLAKGEKP